MILLTFYFLKHLLNVIHVYSRLGISNHLVFRVFGSFGYRLAIYETSTNKTTEQSLTAPYKSSLYKT